MSLLEQTASAAEGAGDSPFLFDPNLCGEQQITKLTTWVASLMETEAPGNLLACGNLDMRSPKPLDTDSEQVTIAGGFNSKSTEWTWSIDITNTDGSLRLISDVDLPKKTEADQGRGYKFDIARQGDDLIATPGEGLLNMPNLWQQISFGHQGKLKREHFVYDGDNQLATYIRKAFFRNVFLNIEPLQIARETAEDYASRFKPGFTMGKIVPYNAVGFRGSTGIRTLGFASPSSYHDHNTKAEHVISVDDLPASLGRVLNEADPVFECPVAILDPKDFHKIKHFDIKSLPAQ